MYVQEFLISLAMKQKQDTIMIALGSFLRVELEDIRRFFGAKMPSRIRKGEVVVRLGAYIVEKPAEWLGRMLERDLRLMKRLVDAGPGVPLYLDYPDFPSVLETVRLLGSDTSDANFRKVWLSKELYDIVSPYIDDAISAGESNGAFELERAALGYLNLYGVMTVDDYYDRMLDYWDYSNKFSLKEFNNLVFDSPVLRLCRCEIEGTQYVTSPNIFEPEDIINGRKDYDGVKDSRVFTPQDALEAGAGSPYFVYGLGTEAGKKFVDLLGNLGYSGDDLIREEHDLWMNAQMLDKDSSAEDIFSCVSKKEDVIEDFGDFNDCMEIVAAYSNSLPKWLLKGYSSNEVNYMKVILQSEESPLDSLMKKNPILGLFIPPVPPDDPCPCGSGLSYRWCHGRLKN